MEKIYNKEFGERLKNYRIQKGLSQENIADLLKKSKSTISRYENEDDTFFNKLMPAIRKHKGTIYGSGVKLYK